MELLKRISAISVTVWILVGIFIVVISQVFIPAVSGLFRGSVLFLAPFVAFSLFGGLLIFLTLKKKIGGLLKKFLILTGASAAGLFIFILLHNFIYGVAIYFAASEFWREIAYGSEIFFFLLATIVCPIGFLTGAIGSIILLIKRRKNKELDSL